jgi:SAM-dependent methyltransferase
MNWRFAYGIGFHPWEGTDPRFARKISELFGREEKGREPPFGLALDLGTGSGIWGIDLAKRGWQVTGIDIVDKALRRARDRVQKAGVHMRLVHGDVTALRAAGIESGFRLVLARHRDLPRPEQRPARRDRSGGQRGRRARCNRTAARVAEAQETADTGCEP